MALDEVVRRILRSDRVAHLYLLMDWSMTDGAVPCSKPNGMIRIRVMFGWFHMV